MGIGGPAPKPKGQRVRRHQDTFTPNRTLVPDGKLRGPRLPKDVDWCERTLKWWNTWRRSPQAQLMTDTDWDAMFEAAAIHNAIWGNPSGLKPGELTGMTKELHRILSAYGLTYTDRLKMRVQIGDERQPEGEESPGEVPSNVVPEYRKLLGKP
jgi:hypothetical protein